MLLGERLTLKPTVGSHSLWCSLADIQKFLLAKRSCFWFTPPAPHTKIHTVDYRKRPSPHILGKPMGIVEGKCKGETSDDIVWNAEWSFLCRYASGFNMWWGIRVQSNHIWWAEYRKTKSVEEKKNINKWIYMPALTHAEHVGSQHIHSASHYAPLHASHYVKAILSPVL